MGALRELTSISILVGICRRGKGCVDDRENTLVKGTSAG
jgi:hypothetical protein